ncbi:MAG: GFA family protein [Asticcacaulis sp.]
MRVRAEDITVEGEMRTWVREGSRGTMRCEFCPECGTRMFHIRPGSFNVKGGTFDDRSWMRPAGHIWAGSKQPFFAIAAGEISYERQPPDYDALTARWRQMTGA